MKHLIKFNENKEEIDDIDDIVNYIKLVFTEFSDDPNYNLEYAEIRGYLKVGNNTVKNILAIYLYQPGINKNKKIHQFIDNANKIVEFYSDIDVCMKRINDEYPIVEFVLEYRVEEDDNYPGIFFELLCIRCRINVKK